MKNQYSNFLLFEQEPRLIYFSGPDAYAENNDSEMVKVAAAENRIILNRMLGISLDQEIAVDQINNESLRIATDITNRIIDNVDTTRNFIQQAELQNLLNSKISQALNGVTRFATETRITQLSSSMDTIHSQQIRAIADAVRSLQSNILDDFMRYGMPVALDTKPDVPRHTLAMDIVFGNKNRRVLVDTRHSFWRTEGPFADAAAMAAVLETKRLVDAGISVQPSDGLSHDYRISNLDATNMANANLDVILTTNKYDALQESLRDPATGEVTEYKVNIDQLIGYKVPNGTIPGLDGRYVGDLNNLEIRDFLKYDPPNYPNWNRFVLSSSEIDPFDTIPIGGAIYLNRVIQEIYTKVGNGTPTSPLAQSSTVPLHVIQADLREQHQYTELLRDGSQNNVAAAVANQILRDHKDQRLRDVLGGGDIVDIDRRLQEARDRKVILQRFTTLETEAVPAVEYSFTDLGTHIGVLGGANPYSGIAGSVSIGIAPNIETFAWDGSNKSAASCQNRIDKKLGEIRTERQNYIRLAQKLANHANLLENAGFAVAGTNLGPLVTLGPPHAANADALDPSIDIQSALQTTRLGLPDLHRTEAEYDSDITDLQLERKRAEAGMISGDRAQHAVITRYLELYHGMTPKESRGASNTMRSRALLDGQLMKTALKSSKRVFGSAPINERISLTDRTKSAFSRVTTGGGIGYRTRVLNMVAQYAGIDPGTNGRPNWNNAEPDELFTAYYAIKSLVQGAGPAGSERIALQREPFLQREMAEVTRLILSKNTKELLQQFDAQTLDMSAEERAQMLQDPTKAEHKQILENILASDPPQHYKQNIDDILYSVSESISPVRKNLSRLTGFTARKLWSGGGIVSKQIIDKSKTTLKPTKAGLIGGAVGGLLVFGYGAPIGYAVGNWISRFRNPGDTKMLPVPTSNKDPDNGYTPQRLTL